MGARATEGVPPVRGLQTIPSPRVPVVVRATRRVDTRVNVATADVVAPSANLSHVVSRQQYPTPTLQTVPSCVPVVVPARVDPRFNGVTADIVVPRVNSSRTMAQRRDYPPMSQERIPAALRPQSIPGTGLVGTIPTRVDSRLNVASDVNVDVGGTVEASVNPQPAVSWQQDQFPRREKRTVRVPMLQTVPPPRLPTIVPVTTRGRPRVNPNVEDHVQDNVGPSMGRTITIPRTVAASTQDVPQLRTVPQPSFPEVVYVKDDSCCDTGLDVEVEFVPRK